MLLIGHQIAFSYDGDGWEFKSNLGREGLQDARCILVIIRCEVYIHHVHRHQRKTIILKELNQLSEKFLLSEQLDLPRTINDYVIILPDDLVQLLCQPFLILEKVLHAEYQASIRS